MGHWCCIKGCSSKTGHSGIRFFSFPAYRKDRGQQMEDLSRRRRLAWVAAVGRKDITFNQISVNRHVCSLHFHKGQPAYEMMESDADWAPSLRLSHTEVKPMVYSCWVRGCTNRADGSVKRGFYIIPKIRKSEGTQMVDLTAERRRVWLKNINRKDPPSRILRVCSDHFISGRPAHVHDKSNPDWAPTLKLGGTLTLSESARERQRSESKQNRDRRAKDQARSKEMLQGSQTLLDSGTVLDPEVLAAPVDTQEDEHDHEETAPLSESQLHSELQRLRTEQIMLKVQINDLKFNEKSFENNSHKVTYYTGLPSFLTLMTVFDLVKSFIPEPKVNSNLGQFECFVMTLMHLKLNLPVPDLAFQFQTSTSTVSRTFLIVIHVLYTRLKNLLYWPERDVLMKTMPLKFQKHFGQKTAVIIDYFEVFIERPKNVLAHAQMWSNYKHSNTVKFLMGITPQGSVSFLSKSWGGRASDKCIIENCGLLLKLLPGDLILADHGFNIQDSVESNCAEVNIPSFSDGKAQLSAVDEETTREVAHVRTHVERLSGLVRNKYTLLQARLPVDYLIKNDDGLPVVDKIVTVACALTNLCDSVVSLTRA